MLESRPKNLRAGGGGYGYKATGYGCGYHHGDTLGGGDTLNSQRPPFKRVDVITLLSQVVDA